MTWRDRWRALSEPRPIQMADIWAIRVILLLLLAGAIVRACR